MTAARARRRAGRAALLALALAAAPVARAEIPALPAEGADTISLNLGGLVEELERKTGEKTVMIGPIEGAYAPELSRLLAEALFRAGLKTAHTAEQMKALREQYRKQG